MAIYTIIMDWKGGTFLRQVESESKLSALKVWSGEIDFVDIGNIINNILPDLTEENLVAVEGHESVWCTDFLLDDKLAVVHIVKTSSVPEFNG